MHKDISLYVVLRRDIGRQFFSRFIAFPVLGKHAIIPWVCEDFSSPFL